jgi:hypothetical protein
MGIVEVGQRAAGRGIRSRISTDFIQGAKLKTVK